MMLKSIIFLALLSCISTSAAVHNILDYGAIPNINTWEAALVNSKAIQNAYMSANAQKQDSDKAWLSMDIESRSAQYWEQVHTFSASPDNSLPFFHTTEQTVLIPANNTFYISYTPISNISHVTLQFDGKLIINNDHNKWESLSLDHHFGALQFTNCHSLTFVGKGTKIDGLRTTLENEKHDHINGVALPTQLSKSKPHSNTVDIDGHGYQWWVDVIISKYKDHRPHMMLFEECTTLTFINMTVVDSPQFHFQLTDARDIYFNNIYIYVDVNKQKALHAQAHAEAQSLFESKLQFNWNKLFPKIDLPTFPLNTDGIDPAAINVLVENFYIENYDDAFAIKPCKKNYIYCNCASNMLMRNGNTKYSVGLSIGSVPPNTNTNCVRNITFDDVHMNLPFKALYVKTNPGVNGDGIIDTIVYNNIKIKTPLWYPIWIGPQQQKQPNHGADTGCSFFYPLNGTCSTQPRVTVSSIHLNNVTSTGGVTLPGVILCDPANPCTDIQFNNVKNTGTWLVRKHYVCKNTKGSQSNNNPKISCLN